MKCRKRKVTLAQSPPSPPPPFHPCRRRKGEDSTGLSDEFHFTGYTPFLPFLTDDLRDVHRRVPHGARRHRVPPLFYFDFRPFPDANKLIHLVFLLNVIFVRFGDSTTCFRKYCNFNYTGILIYCSWERKCSVSYFDFLPSLNTTNEFDCHFFDSKS